MDRASRGTAFEFTGLSASQSQWIVSFNFCTGSGDVCSRHFSPASLPGHLLRDGRVSVIIITAAQQAPDTFAPLKPRPQRTSSSAAAFVPESYGWVRALWSSPHRPGPRVSSPAAVVHSAHSRASGTGCHSHRRVEWACLFP